jgi:hypothetical protein
VDARTSCHWLRDQPGPSGYIIPMLSEQQKPLLSTGHTDMKDIPANTDSTRPTKGAPLPQQRSSGHPPTCQHLGTKERGRQYTAHSCPLGPTADAPCQYRARRAESNCKLRYRRILHKLFSAVAHADQCITGCCRDKLQILDWSRMWTAAADKHNLMPCSVIAWRYWGMQCILISIAIDYRGVHSAAERCSLDDLELRVFSGSSITLAR